MTFVRPCVVIYEYVYSKTNHQSQVIDETTQTKLELVVFIYVV